MAVSGSKNYSINRADIINAALRKTGDYDAGESPSGSETQDAATALNLLVKNLVVKGADIWLRQTVTLFLQPGTESYSLGTAHATTSYVETTLSAAEASGQTVISVTDSTGMTAADNVGIKMDDNTIHWSTIATVDSSTQITIDNATDDDAASGNKVYAYTTKATRPVKLVYAHRRDTSGLDAPITLIGEAEYRSLSDKDASGQPTTAWYHPTLDNGTLYVWPTDGGSTLDKVVLVAQYYPDDFDSAADNPQLPIEWGKPLIYLLAADLGYESGLDDRKQLRLEQKANQLLDDALDYDVENASVILELQK